MSLRQTIEETFKSIKNEFKKFEFSDVVLDLIAIAGFVLFLVALVSVFLASKFNTVNIVFILYPLGVAGSAAAFRMRRREKPEETPKLFRDWLIVIGTMTAIAVLIMILAFVIY
ncbi:MAG: hypothetical protein ACFFDS_08995 [Candidatus Thorarchaeota archaeon]